eukprot:TRINITY_DN45654_c0_g1_i1.p1 TRINITY_DN45654_c0_g1~~TRINITY_DN45654_c0_g1_i1.p1  ORF type:complete len:362 (-),score=35.81 TRINITY_DN45654_c0_g1_i1:104-1093(-)
MRKMLLPVVVGRPEFQLHNGRIHRAGSGFFGVWRERLLLMSTLHVFGPAGGWKMQESRSSLRSLVSSVVLRSFSDESFSSGGHTTVLVGASPHVNEDDDADDPTGDILALLVSTSPELDRSVFRDEGGVVAGMLRRTSPLSVSDIGSPIVADSPPLVIDSSMVPMVGQRVLVLCAEVGSASQGRTRRPGSARMHSLSRAEVAAVVSRGLSPGDAFVGTVFGIDSCSRPGLTANAAAVAAAAASNSRLWVHLPADVRLACFSGAPIVDASCTHVLGMVVGGDPLSGGGARVFGMPVPAMVAWLQTTDIPAVSPRAPHPDPCTPVGAPHGR